MIRAALHDDVARPANGLALVHDQNQFAFQHDAVVDGFGAVHVRVFRSSADARRGIARAHFGKVRARLFGRYGIQLVPFGRDVEHADVSAFARVMHFM